MKYLLLLLIVPIVAIVFALDNLLNYIKTARYLRLYMDFVNTKADKNTFADVIPLTKKIMSKAEIPDYTITVRTPASYPYSTQLSLQSEPTHGLNDKEIFSKYCIMLSQTKTVFKSRMWNYLNPIEWLKFLIFLPSNLLKYFNVTSSTAYKLVQVIYWATAAVLAILKIFQVIP